MATRELNIPLVAGPDCHGGKLQFEKRAVFRWTQGSKKVEPLDDSGECLIYRAGTHRTKRVSPADIAEELGAIMLSDDYAMSTDLLRWLDEQVDEVIENERDDAARYGETGT